MKFNEITVAHRFWFDWDVSVSENLQLSGISWSNRDYFPFSRRRDSSLPIDTGTVINERMWQRFAGDLSLNLMKREGERFAERLHSQLHHRCPSSFLSCKFRGWFGESLEAFSHTSWCDQGRIPPFRETITKRGTV